MVLRLCVGPVPRPEFGVVAESGGNQRMEWVLLARARRRETWLGGRVSFRTEGEGGKELIGPGVLKMEVCTVAEGAILCA